MRFKDQPSRFLAVRRKYLRYQTYPFKKQRIAVLTQQIPVVFCFDANYAPYAAVATFSLARSAQNPLKIYWVVSRDLEKASFLRDHLKNLGIEVSITVADGNPFAHWKTKDHVNTAANLRLLIPTVIKEAKVIYLDCDTLVLADLAPLYETDTKDFAIGGVIDPDGPKFNKILQNGREYMNSGVLLMNLDLMREEEFLKKCADIYAKYQDAVLYPDQCVINKFSEGRKVFLDPKWNRLIWAQLTDNNTWQQAIAEGKSKILHFIGSVKPWEEWCNPMIADFWWTYARKLGLADLHPIKITNLPQLLSLACALDVIERFKDASKLKTDVIHHLLKVPPPQSPSTSGVFGEA